MIRLEHVTKRFGDKLVLADLSMEMVRGEITVLLGPSGCGKTTTLKLLNGLIAPTSGRIMVDGVDVASADPIALRRKMGYVIQDVGLFPHFRIFDNIAVVPRLLGWDRARVEARVREMLRLVNLSDELLERFPRQLSGGQRQRVGVARALAGDPQIVLMDEPFGAVDPVNRAFIQEEFAQIQRRLGLTVVLVTHDLDEALKLGHRVAVFHSGQLLQFDPPAALLASPATPEVAEFLGPDRATRLLRTRTVGELVAATAGVEAAGGPALAHETVPDDLATLGVHTSLAEALARLSLSGARAMAVVGPAGDRVGTLSLEAVVSAAHGGQTAGLPNG